MKTQPAMIWARSWWIWLAALLSIWLLAGCAGTVTPDHVLDGQAAVDSSTPQQYPQANNGFIGYRGGKGIITEHKRQEYNALIEKYRLQFKNDLVVELNLDAGLTRFRDQYGNDLWSIDKEHLIYFAKLKQWQRDHREGDSVWAKAKDKAGL